MLDKVGIFDYLEHIKRAKESLSSAQWQDQFKLRITRERPSTSVIVKPEDVVSYSINYGEITLDTMKAGSANINIVSGIDSLSISVVLREMSDDRMAKFLSRSDNNLPIIPQDGTFLLPYDYYFYIEAFMLDSRWNERRILSGDFALNGGITKDFVTEGGDSMSVTAEFKPIMSNNIQWK